MAQVRLRIIVPGEDRSRAILTRFEQGRFLAVPLGNGLFLSLWIRVRLVPGGVTTEHASIAYRCSEELSGDDWVFRYDYERQQAESGGYPYPAAHLHVNAQPACYRGPKPFPDLHLPTHRLSLEEIIHHLIVEHDVPALGSREVALTFLDRQQAGFDARRTDRR